MAGQPFSNWKKSRWWGHRRPYVDEFDVSRFAPLNDQSSFQHSANEKQPNGTDIAFYVELRRQNVKPL